MIEFASTLITYTMDTNKLLNGTTQQNPDYMRRLILANDVTLSECINNIKRNKAVINFHTSTYCYQQADLYNPIELAAAMIDLHANCTMIINKLNELI